MAKDPDAPYGRREDGTPLTMAEYANNTPALSAQVNNVGTYDHRDVGGPTSEWKFSGSTGGKSKYGFDPAPERFETYDPKTGKLKKKFRLDVAKERGITPMGKLELDRQRSLLKSNIGDMYGRSAAGMADARGRLAQTGGLGGGAAERIQRSGNRDRMNALQRMYGGHQRNQLGIRSQDIGRQIQADQNNITNNLGEIERTYQGQLQSYDIGAKIHSGEIMADAIGRGGGGGGGPGGLLGGMMNPNLLGVAGGVAGGISGGPWGAAGGYAAGNWVGEQTGFGLQGQSGGGGGGSGGQPQMQQQTPSSSGSYQTSMPTAGYQQGMGQPMQNAYGQRNPYSSGM